MVQTNYGFNTPIGQPGGLYDLSPVEIDSFLNEAATGALGFGMGVVKGTAAGTGVALPGSSSAAVDFEGIVVNRRTTENNDDGVPVIKNKATVGVLRYGRIYVKLATGADPAYGEALYMVKTGDDAGCFTDSSSSTVAIKGRFLTAAIDGIAAVELFNQAQS